MNKVYEVRIQKGMSQRLLAEKCHISASLISMVERGELKVWPKLRKRLVRVLETTPEELFPTEQEAPKERG